MRPATRGELYLGAGKAAHVSLPAPSSVGLDRLFAPAEGAIAVVQAGEKGDSRRATAGVWRMSDKLYAQRAA